MSTNINKATEISLAGNYPENRLNQRERKVLQVSAEYSPAVPANWASTPTTLDGALDQLAAQNLGGILQTASVTYDFSVNGGATGSVALGKALPAKAIVVEVTADVLTQIAGAGTVQLTVPTEGAIQSGSLSSSDAVGPQFKNPASPKKVAAARNLQATIAGAVVTAGKIQYFIRYYQGQ